MVIGGDAAGMSAASQARRRRADLEIIAFERSGWASYSACGEPYYVAGYVDPLERLIARTPERFADMNIDLRVRHEVEEIDLANRAVEIRDLLGERTFKVEFDQLLIATGATAVRPDITGITLDGVHELRTLDDAAALRAIADRGSGSAVVVGGGYIGLEVAEAFAVQGWTVTVVTSGESVLERTLDADLGAIVVAGMEDHNIRVITGERVRCINGADNVESVGCEGETIEADVVILGMGSRPEVELAEAAGIPLGETGAIAVDDHQRTSIEGVWSAGDCAEAMHRITGSPANFHLGTVANKTGRVAGINIGGGDVRFPGVLGTAITKVCEVEVAMTGLRESAAVGLVSGDAEGTTTAGYWPGAAPIRIRATAERGSGRLMGAQIVGGPGSAKRIDVFATALWSGMTAGDLAWADLAYAPPFSGVWDLIHIAARRAAEAAAR